jgi:hypothetical protein
VVGERRRENRLPVLGARIQELDVGRRGDAEVERLDPVRTAVLAQGAAVLAKKPLVVRAVETITASKERPPAPHAPRR